MPNNNRRGSYDGSRNAGDRRRGYQENRGYDRNDGGHGRGQSQSQQQGVRIQQDGPKKPPIAPVTHGDVRRSVVIGCVVTLILALLLMTGATMLNMSQRNAEMQATLDQANAIVKQAQAEIQLSPTEETVKQITSANVNIKVTKGTTTTNVDVPEQNNASIGEGDSGSTAADADTNGIGVDTSTGETGTDEAAPATQGADEGGDIAYGAGTIVTSDGNIVTNMHVVENASSIVVTVGDTDYNATVTGTDPTSDIATIKIPAKNLPVVKFGDSSKVYQGQWAMAVGNPYGMTSSVSTGSISAVGRDIPYEGTTSAILYADMIQSDATVNPGNSGGGLYNSSGEFIGMVSIITTDNESTTGLSYAIPSNLLIPIARNLIQGKSASHAVLGLGLGDVTEDFAKQNGLQNADGALVTSVTPSGPADNVKMTTNDVITKYNGEKVKNAQDLMFKVRASTINDTATLTVMRNGKEMTFNVKLGSDV